MKFIIKESNQQLEMLVNKPEMKRKPWESDNSSNPKCPVCCNHQENVIMRIICGPCWKCGEPMNVAMLRANGTKGPEEFTSEEIAFAEGNGVILKVQYSKSMEESYLANTCLCGEFAGQFGLFKSYWSPAEYGLDSHKLVIENDTDFHYCLHCEEANATNSH